MLRKIPHWKVEEMQMRCVFVYDTFLRSLGTQVLTGLWVWKQGLRVLVLISLAALEAARLNLFSTNREEERMQFIHRGFGFDIQGADKAGTASDYFPCTA